PPSQLPASFLNADLIAGSTTNITIAQARSAWVAPVLGAQFPYFDTNADGIVDLYDADGDGVPDSPISFRIPLGSSDPNDPETLYAVVRIVDHAGMLNVNVASSWNGSLGGGLMFNESSPDLQRRGRRLTELLLDPALHAGDLQAGFANRASGLVNHRRGTVNQYLPWAYDVDVVRRDLLGGLTGGFGYLLYGGSDEASLRHRGLLAPFGLRDFNKAQQQFSDGFESIDTALPWTLLWTRLVDANANYLNDRSRWTRFNANLSALLNSDPTDNLNFEGFLDSNGLGWRSLLQEDHPAAIRRQMFTTVSHEVVPPVTAPSVSPVGQSLGQVMLSQASFQPVTVASASTPGVSLPVSMRFPVSPAGPAPLKVRPVDLNMTLGTGAQPAQVEGLKRDYIGALAGAMYLAIGELVGNGQSATSLHGLEISPPTPASDVNRQRLAWQWSLNMADYRDSDGLPTRLDYPDATAPGGVRHLFGLEKQPFLTEAYARVEYQGEQPPNPLDDKWFYAVELFVPAPWIIDQQMVSRLWLRVKGVPDASQNRIIALREFFNNSGAGVPPSELNGYPTPATSVAGGRYFVFYGGDVSAAPGAFTPGVDKFYKSMFEFADTGNGSVELVYSTTGTPSDPDFHVLDVIDPDNSGSSFPGITGPNGGPWAKRAVAPKTNDVEDFSLLRSTKDWRFTTAWHRLVGSGSSGGIGAQPSKQSLGGPNSTNGVSDTPQLDDAVAPWVWPGRSRLSTVDASAVAAGEVLGGFASATPYEAFDSVGEISRIPMIGPAFPGFPLPGTLSSVSSATEHLAKILEQAPGSGPPDPATGRIDFTQPWAARLFSFLTTQSAAFFMAQSQLQLGDFIDNDGDNLTDEADEAARVLYRVAGRININTAPVTVLRTVPFMSLLPTSPEFSGFGTGDAVTDFNTAPNQFWDMASAIVARREERPVPLRLPNATGQMLTVAEAKLAPGAGSNEKGPFRSVAELATMTSAAMDNTLLGTDAPFSVDRYVAPGLNPPLALNNHNTSNGLPTIGVDDPFSPDFRLREGPTVDYAPTGLGPNNDAGGIRGRDIYLARWAGLLTTRSDVFTAYIALIDEDGNYVRRTQVTLDRSVCFREVREPNKPVIAVLPTILGRTDGSYTDDAK
ncbi:MAG: hypothetical protein ACE5F9_15410, partial [Phycisphaerae bacterium]